MSLITFLIATLAALAAAYPSLQSLGAQRPTANELTAWPKQLDHQWHSPARNPSRVCVVPASGEDVTPALISAAHQCNNGGTVVLPAGANYTIATAADLTFLQSIDIAILGSVVFKDDLDYWQTHGYNYSFQGATLMWRFGGQDVNIYGLGKGVLDGQGQTWWTNMTSNSALRRPIIFGTDGLRDATVSGLKMLNSPNWFNFISNSSNVVITDIELNVVVTNKSSPAKNTDGWDTYRSDNIVIQNSKIDNTDDCVSFKPNSTNIIVQNLWCNGSHGISVGSLGQYRGQFDIVENVYVYNTSMNNAGDGARIKVWPGVAPNASADVNGGGSGYVKNITYELFGSNNVDSPITLTQCYFAASQAACDQYPASLVIENVTFQNFHGKASAKNDPRVGSIVCSSEDVCKNIQVHNFTVTPPSGRNSTFQCVNTDNSLLDVNCVS